MGACSSPQALPAGKLDGSSRLKAEETVASPGRLKPQSEGTPLPPRNPHVADHWPSEFRLMIDNLLALYPRDGKPPSVKEVEKKMGITLTERPLQDLETGLYKRYTVGGTRYVDTKLEKFGGMGQYYAISKARPPGGMLQSLRLVVSPAQSGFCLDPYELAVYTGSKFLNGDTSQRARPRIWPAAYVWGMFEWSENGRYIGENFDIVLGQERDVVMQKVVGASCVVSIGVLGRYAGE